MRITYGWTVKISETGVSRWAFVLEFDWTDGGGIPRTSVVLDYIELGVTVAGRGRISSLGLVGRIPCVAGTEKTGCLAAKAGMP